MDAVDAEACQQAILGGVADQRRAIVAADARRADELLSLFVPGADLVGAVRPGGEILVAEAGRAAAPEHGAPAHQGPGVVVGFQGAGARGWLLVAGGPERTVADHVVDAGDDVLAVGEGTGTDVFGQQQRAGFDDGDAQAVVGEFDAPRLRPTCRCR